MKLSISTFIAAVSATSWPGQAHNGTIYNYCGTKVTLAADSINATCTLDFNGFDFAHISIPGCFSQGKGSNVVECNGIEGVTDAENLDVTIFWQQELDFDNNLMNSTCAEDSDVTVACQPNGQAPSDPMFDNISNNFHARNSEQWNLIQIYGVGSENYAVSLNDALGNPAAISNYTCGLCSSIEAVGSNQLTFTVNMDAFSAQLFELVVESDALISQQTSTIVAV